MGVWLWLWIQGAGKSREKASYVNSFEIFSCRYLASGGLDSIVNLFDLRDWIVARTLTTCEYDIHILAFILIDLSISFINRHSVNDLDFSYDGEYLAIASTGSYIEIVSPQHAKNPSRTFQTHPFQSATETGAPVHRIPALTPSPTISWHPSKHVAAYCGQIKAREGGPPPVAIVSIFGSVE